MNPNPIGQLSDTRSLILKAYAAMKEEAWDAAKELADASLRACKLTGDYLGEINARHLQARIDHETGQLETAAKQYEQVHQLSEAIDYKDGIARVKHEMGRIYSRRGEF